VEEPSEEEESSSSSEEAKPVHAIVAPISTDKHFWVCEIPLSDVENQDATRHISELLSDLQDRRATRASYVQALCVAQSVVFGAIPLQRTKANYSECAKKSAPVDASTENAAVPNVTVVEGTSAPGEEPVDDLMTAKEEVPKNL